VQKYGNEIKKTAIKIIDGGFFNFKITEKITLQNHQSGYARQESRSLLPFFEPLGSSVSKIWWAF
jgi:hypothetical protein